MTRTPQLSHRPALCRLPSPCASVGRSCGTRTACAGHRDGCCIRVIRATLPTSRPPPHHTVPLCDARPPFSPRRMLHTHFAARARGRINQPAAVAPKQGAGYPVRGLGARKWRSRGREHSHTPDPSARREHSHTPDPSARREHSHTPDPSARREHSHTPDPSPPGLLRSSWASSESQELASTGWGVSNTSLSRPTCAKPDLAPTGNLKPNQATRVG